MTGPGHRRAVHALRALACRIEAGDVYVNPTTGNVYVYMVDAPPVGVAALLAAMPDPVIDVQPDRSRCTVSGLLLTMHVHLVELRLSQALQYLQAPAKAGVS